MPHGYSLVKAFSHQEINEGGTLLQSRFVGKRSKWARKTPRDFALDI
jgi:hypothetical protein